MSGAKKVHLLGTALNGIDRVGAGFSECGIYGFHSVDGAAVTCKLCLSYANQRNNEKTSQQGTPHHP
jgi:hypothetical protein